MAPSPVLDCNLPGSREGAQEKNEAGLLTSLRTSFGLQQTSCVRPKSLAMLLPQKRELGFSQNEGTAL